MSLKIENIKIKIMEMKNAITKMLKVTEGLNSRINTV